MKRLPYAKPPVVWVPCQSCGREWPFPVGAAQPTDLECQRCLVNTWAGKARALQDVLDKHKECVETVNE